VQLSGFYCGNLMLLLTTLCCACVVVFRVFASATALYCPQFSADSGSFVQELQGRCVNRDDPWSSNSFCCGEDIIFLSTRFSQFCIPTVVPFLFWFYCCSAQLRFSRRSCYLICELIVALLVYPSPPSIGAVRILPVSKHSCS
jgi:hypothetical protein